MTEQMAPQDGPITKTHERALVRAIFENSQGDSSYTEIYLIQAFLIQNPGWRIKREEDFLERTIKPITSITGITERHPKIVDSSDITESLKRLRRRQREARQKFTNMRSRGEIPTLDDEGFIGALAIEMICRDWLYLVNDGGRPKEGLRRDQSYNPNNDRWISYIAYYALWKDSEGKRRSTGVREMDVVYEKVGEYLEVCLPSELGIEESYDEGEGMAIFSKLTEALRVYNYNQTRMGFPQHCVWEDKLRSISD